MHPLSKGMSCRPNNIHRLLRRRARAPRRQGRPAYVEEPCISGTTGSGTVFFSGCTLRCVFCQNFQLSHENYGKTISVSRLADIFLELQEKGAANINLVTGTQFAPSIVRALDLAKPKLQIPVVFNCGGYEKLETIRDLADYVDILASRPQIHGQPVSPRNTPPPRTISRKPPTP